MGNCVFCEIISKKIPSSIVYEDEQIVVFMDNFPINPGHVLIASKEHYSNIAETPTEVLSNLMQMVFTVESALWRSGIACEGTNILHSNGEAAGQDVFHTHFHVVPRYSDDGFEIAYGTIARNRYELDKAAKMITNSLAQFK